MVYPDLSSALSLLFHGANTAEVSRLISEAEGVEVSVLHRLQIENGIIRSLQDAARREASAKALLLWRRYLDEEVFQVMSFDLEAAVLQAVAWNASAANPPKWSVLIHAAIAASAGATFLSFDPALRRHAASAGATLLPLNLRR